MKDTKNAHQILVANNERKKPLKYLDIVTRIILKWITNKCGMDCIRLAQDRNKYRGLVKKTMNFGFYKRREISLSAE
jgi:hypothetical protein